MATEERTRAPMALKILEPTAAHRVCIMTDNTVRVLGDVSALTGTEARKLAYALMSAGAQV